MRYRLFEEKFFPIILVLVVAYCLLLTRLEHFVSADLLKALVGSIPSAAFAAGFLLLVLSRPRFGVKLALFCGLLLLHAAASFYQPSLRFGVPFDDYMLADSVSANWSFSLARGYILYVAGAFALCFSIGSDSQKSLRVSQLVFSVIAVCAALNAGVAVYQHFVDPAFLAAGSGTALAALRNPGLLEDSGASSVFFGITFSGFFWSVLASRRSLPLLGCLLGLVVTGVAGFFGAGRVFYLCAAFSMLTGFVFFSLAFLVQRQWKRFLSVCLLAVGTLFAGLIAINASSLSLEFQRVMEHRSTLLSHETKAGFMQSIDPVRWGHMEVMWEATKDHLWTGSGLGSFFAHNVNYSKKLDIPFSYDWPSSFYLMLSSELGLVGLLLIVLLFGMIAASLYRLVVSLQKDDGPGLSDTAIQAAAIGGAIGLGAAWLIGIHIVFPSIAMLVGAIFAVLARSVHMYGRAAPAVSWSARIAAVYVCCVIAYLAWTAPRIPEFMWLDRGQPQEPNTFQEMIEGRKGRWVRAYGEKIFDGSPQSVLIKHPDEAYPVELDYTILNPKGQVAYHSKSTINERSWLELPTTDALRAACAAPTQDAFCSYVLQVNKTWTYDGQKLGVFVADASHQQPD